MYNILFHETTVAERKRFLPFFVTHEQKRWNSDLRFHNDYKGQSGYQPELLI
jgi:hypothetical protein